MANSVLPKFVLLPLNAIRLQNLKFVFTVKAGDDKSNASRKLPVENTPAEILRVPKIIWLGLLTNEIREI